MNLQHRVHLERLKQENAVFTALEDLIHETSDSKEIIIEKKETLDRCMRNLKKNMQLL